LATSFLALYRGESVSTAKLVALTADPELVRDFARRLLQEPQDQQPDVVVQELEHGRRRALELIRSEAN
jgi:hypothetical protein